MEEIIVNDKMQKNYTYVLEEPVGKNFKFDFAPEVTPKEMLELGVLYRLIMLLVGPFLYG